MTGLRERRHLETKTALVDATFELLRSTRFDSLTMETIAERAGISRSTAYRRFASKEEIILEVPLQWYAAWDQAQAELPDDAPLLTAMTNGCLAVSSQIDTNHELVMLAFGALAESPTLQSSGAATTAWTERMSATVSTHRPDLDQFEVNVLAGAWMGAIDAMMMTWVSTGGEGSVLALTQRLIARLELLLP